MKQCSQKYLLPLFGFLICINAFSQYSNIRDSTTKKIIYAKVFDIIASHVDTSNWYNFKEIKKDKPRIIYYSFSDSSQETKVFENLVTIPPFKRMLIPDISDSVVKSITLSKNKTRFIKLNKSRPSKIKCALFISPLVGYRDRIYIRVFATSPGYYDDMYGAELNFVFNKYFDLIYFDERDAIF